MKGIESIIAIILVLMIVIALAALAYTWFSGIFASLTSTAGSAMTSTTNEMVTQFKIEFAKGGATYTAVTIRNIGTQNINASTSQIAFYIDGSLVVSFLPASQPISCNPPCGACPNCIVYPNGVATYNMTNPATPTCGTSTIKATLGTGVTNSQIISC
jgi:flagellin-like protein